MEAENHKFGFHTVLTSFCLKNGIQFSNVKLYHFPYDHSIKVGVGAIVCEEAILKGDITIGSRSVVHPRASIIAEAGPIIIGEGNIVEEMATITNRLDVQKFRVENIIFDSTYFNLCSSASSGYRRIKVSHPFKLLETIMYSKWIARARHPKLVIIIF